MTNPERDLLIQTTHDLLTAHCAKEESLWRDILTMQKSIYGNGRPGLKDRLQALEVDRGIVSKARSIWLTFGLASAGSVITILIQKVLGHF